MPYKVVSKTPSVSFGCNKNAPKRVTAPSYILCKAALRIKFNRPHQISQSLTLHRLPLLTKLWMSQSFKTLQKLWSWLKCRRKIIKVTSKRKSSSRLLCHWLQKISITVAKVLKAPSHRLIISKQRTLNWLKQLFGWICPSHMRTNSKWLVWKNNTILLPTQKFKITSQKLWGCFCLATKLSRYSSVKPINQPSRWYLSKLLSRHWTSRYQSKFSKRDLLLQLARLTLMRKLKSS